MSVAVFLYQQAGDSLPESLGTPAQAMTTFHYRATECLLLSKYLRPTTYTIEALLVNIQQEFLRSIDLDDSLWILAATIIRLAMKMGYHRDSAPFPQISPFQAEMRRRVWSIILQLDVLVSCLFGLPRMIVEDQHDTSPPRNLLDDDFDENSIELPPSRSDADYTQISFTIAKGRILKVFADVVSQYTSVQPQSHPEVMRLDSELNTAHASIPEHLKMRGYEQSITVAPSIIIRRYLLELLYQKARLLLHRGQMVKARHDPACKPSRSICVDAAMNLLRHQVAIHQEAEQGGILHRDKWFLWSLEQNDFILAAMIVALELSFSLEDGQSYKPPADEFGRVTYDQQTLMQAVRGSHSVWTSSSTRSRAASQAAQLLSVILSKTASFAADEAAPPGYEETVANIHPELHLQNFDQRPSILGKLKYLSTYPLLNRKAVGSVARYFARNFDASCRKPRMTDCVHSKYSVERQRSFFAAER